MKLRLPLNRAIGTRLVALGASLVREANREVARMAADPVGSVHRARVALKRARSALRLLEKAGAAWAIMPRYRLTEVAGRMSLAREAAVAAALAENLSRRLRGRERAAARLLARRQGRLVPPGVEEIRRALLQESNDLAAAPAPVIPPAQLRRLLRRSLERAARRHYAAVKRPTVESVHEWRKAVIALRDHAAFAASRSPGGAGAAHSPLMRLARQLGRAGDLALLVRRLRFLRPPASLAAARGRLMARLEEQRRMAALTALLRWLRLEGRLTRLLAESSRPRQARGHSVQASL